jgi:hypothetical protein
MATNYVRSGRARMRPLRLPRAAFFSRERRPELNEQTLTVDSAARFL